MDRRAVAGRAGGLLLGLAALVPAGCAEPAAQPPRPSPAVRTAPGPSEATTTDDASGGMGVPQLAAVDAPARARPLTAEVEVSDVGCFLARTGDRAEPILVVWPEGTALGDSGDELVLGSGVTVVDGSLLPARGAVVPVRSLPAYAEDGYWAYAVRFCTPDQRRVLVLTEVSAR